jgi:hypothetical protein
MRKHLIIKHVEDEIGNVFFFFFFLHFFLRLINLSLNILNKNSGDFLSKVAFYASIKWLWQQFKPLKIQIQSSMILVTICVEVLFTIAVLTRDQASRAIGVSFNYFYSLALGVHVDTLFQTFCNIYIFKIEVIS